VEREETAHGVAQHFHAFDGGEAFGGIISTVVVERKLSIEEKPQVSPYGFRGEYWTPYKGKIKRRTIILMTTSKMKNL